MSFVGVSVGPLFILELLIFDLKVMNFHSFAIGLISVCHLKTDEIIDKKSSSDKKKLSKICVRSSDRDKDLNNFLAIHL